MNMEWDYILDFTLLSLLLGLGTFLKRKCLFFQKYLIPNAMIAGFIGLILGPDLLKIISLNSERLGEIVYHLMAIGFISLTLKDRERKKNKEIQNTGILIVSTYLIQGIIGFSLSLLLAYTIFPKLFPAMGLLLPLGFGQGPGQAYSIGRQWESLGFIHGGNVGLSIATSGFLWACLGGIPLLNFLIKKAHMTPLDSGGEKVQKIMYEPDAPGDIPLSESIDKISIQLFLIGIVYLLTYLLLKGASFLLTPLGTFGQTLSQLLWGFHFIIGSLIALLLRIIFDFCKKKKIMVRNYPNNYLLQRISGASFDYMIVASIAAISIPVLKEYLVPILLITTIGGFLTMFFLTYLCKKLYNGYVLENILALYGMLTGTISTGMALLREVDPGFESGVAENLVLGSGVGLFFGFPLMMILNIPIFGYLTNQPIMYFYTLLALIGYLIVLGVLLFAKKKPITT